MKLAAVTLAIAGAFGGVASADTIIINGVVQPTGFLPNQTNVIAIGDTTTGTSSSGSGTISPFSLKTIYVSSR